MFWYFILISTRILSTKKLRVHIVYYWSLMYVILKMIQYEILNKLVYIIHTGSTVHVLSCSSPVWLSVKLWTVARQAPLFMGFSRQEYRSGWPSPALLQGIFPTQGSNPALIPRIKDEAEEREEEKFCPACSPRLLSWQAGSSPLVPPGRLAQVLLSSSAQPRPSPRSPIAAARQASLSVRLQLPEPAQTHVRRANDAIQPSLPLSSPSPPALSLSQHQGLFQWVSSSHQLAKEF